MTNGGGVVVNICSNALWAVRLHTFFGVATVAVRYGGHPVGWCDAIGMTLVASFNQKQKRN